MINLMIVDDHPLVRHALKNLIETQPDMKIVAEAKNGEEAVKFAKEKMPDVIVMDIGMPIMNGLEATRQIKTQCPSIAILVLTVHTDNEHVLGILEAGAAGYLTKVVFGDEVIRAIQAIFTGEAVLSPSILQQILGSVKRDSIKVSSTFVDSKLSPREIHLLKLAAKGMSNRNISIELNLGEATVKSYLVAIFSKMNVSSRTEAVITGLKTGLISLSDLE